MIVYSLEIKSTGDIFYVGSTRNSLKTRLKSHRSYRSDSNQSLKKILSENRDDIKIEEIDRGDTYDAVFLEAYWIGQFIEWGFVLCNKNLSVKSLNQKTKKCSALFTAEETELIYSLYKTGDYAAIAELNNCSKSIISFYFVNNLNSVPEWAYMGIKKYYGLPV